MKIEQTIAERDEQYGSFYDVATVSQRLKGILHSANQNQSIRLDAVQREAVDMICTKLARICAGVDPSYDDNWRDIAGYAMLGGKLDYKFKTEKKLNSKFEFGMGCNKFIEDKDLTPLIEQFKKCVFNYFGQMPIKHKGFDKYCISVEMNISPLNKKIF